MHFKLENPNFIGENPIRLKTDDTENSSENLWCMITLSNWSKFWNKLSISKQISFEESAQYLIKNSSLILMKNENKLKSLFLKTKSNWYIEFSRENP